MRKYRYGWQCTSKRSCYSCMRRMGTIRVLEKMAHLSGPALRRKRMISHRYSLSAASAQEGLRGATPGPRSGAAAERSYPVSEVRGGGQEELLHVRCQGQRSRGTTPRPRSGRAAVRRYLLSKVKSSGCTLLEQP